MSKYVKIIFFVFIIGIIVLSGILFHKYNVLENRISSFTQTQTVTGVDTAPPDVIQKFKEDYYIKQLDRDTTLILVLFPVLLGLVAAFSYTSVKEEFKSQIQKVKEDYERKINDFEKTTESFYELEGDVNYEVARFRDSDSLEYYDKKEWEGFVVFKLLAVDYYAKSIFQKKSANDKFVNSVTSTIIANLEEMISVIETEGSDMKMKELAYDKFIRIKNNLEKLENPKINKLIARIFSKLKFELLE